MHKFIYFIPLIVWMLFAVEGNYSDGFYVKGLVQSYYQNTVCDPPFGCTSDSLMVRPYNPTVSQISWLYIFPQIYSTNSTFNGKMLITTTTMVNPHYTNINSDGTYKVWVDVTNIYSWQHSQWARLETIGCNNQSWLSVVSSAKFDTTKTFINDIRVWCIQFGHDRAININKYVSQMKVAGKYSDIVVNYITNEPSTYYQGDLISCSDLLPTGPAIVMNPIFRNSGNSSQTHNYRNTLLNGRVMNRANYLTKWNHIVSIKRP